MKTTSLFIALSGLLGISVTSAFGAVAHEYSCQPKMVVGYHHAPQLTVDPVQASDGWNAFTLKIDGNDVLDSGENSPLVRAAATSPARAGKFLERQRSRYFRLPHRSQGIHGREKLQAGLRQRRRQ